MTTLGTIVTDSICTDCGAPIYIEREEVDCYLCAAFDEDIPCPCNGTGRLEDEAPVCECEMGEDD